ncbi:hypothetical protein [Arthrobacter sp. PAMC25564]|nr:hypothetical protein [Arthrobacter sp. PAMC25564]
MQAPSWGYQLRRGLMELTLEDAALIRSALGRGGTQGKPRQ